jgi:hypothetical protein
MISRIRWKLDSVALSTTETEYVTTNVAIHEVVQLHKLLAGLYSRHDTKGRSEAPILIHK